MADNNIVVSLTAGASLINVQPIFSHDSKYLFVCSRSVIKVFSTSGGNCVHELSGHKKTVTGIVISSKNKLQLLSCSLDRTLILWDYTDGVLLKCYHINFPLQRLLRLDGENESYIGLVESEKHKQKLVRVHLPRGESKRVRAEVLQAKTCRDTKCVAVGFKGSFIVYVRGKEMFIISPEGNPIQQHSLEPEMYFTCVTCHPTAPCVATGCSDGKIYFWRNILNSDAVKTLHHWHSLEVGDLAFTTEGSYLLSGGRECVLVKHHCISQMNNFLPRLGAPITKVVCSDDNMLYATCHSDNVIHIISSAFKLLQIYGGLTVANWASEEEQRIPVGLLCDPRTKALVLNGKPGHLQFFSVHSDKQLFNLDIVCQNYISPENLKRPTVITEIKKAAFNDNGTWIATVEVWNDRKFTPEIRLKFWQFTAQSQTYVLNTTVELTNQDQVHSLKFRPTGCDGAIQRQPMVVNTSLDGKFRLWTLVDDTDIYRENSKWSCQSVGFFRDLPAESAAFSEDGSLLAVVFDYAITLWDPDSNVFQQTLQTYSMQHVREICFGRKGSAHLLVSATDDRVTVWDLLSCSVLWSVDLKVQLLAEDPKTDILAAFTRENNLFIFRPSKPQPIYCHRQVSSREIIGATFVPNTDQNDYSGESKLSWQKESQLYFINKHQKLLTITIKKKTSKHSKLQILHDNLPQTPFSQLVSAEKKIGGQKTISADVVPETPGRAKYMEMLLDTAPHVQPSVVSLCTTFIDALLLHKNQASSDQKEELGDSSESEVDSESDSDSDMDVTPDTQNQQKEEESENDISDDDAVDKIIGHDFQWFSSLDT